MKQFILIFLILSFTMQAEEKPITKKDLSKVKTDAEALSYLGKEVDENAVGLISDLRTTSYVEGVKLIVHNSKYIFVANNAYVIFEVKDKKSKIIGRYDFLAAAIYKKGMNFVMQQDHKFFEDRLLKHNEKRKLIEKTIEYSLYSYGSNPYQIAFDNKIKKVKFIKLVNKK